MCKDNLMGKRDKSSSSKEEKEIMRGGVFDWDTLTGDPVTNKPKHIKLFNFKVRELNNIINGVGGYNGINDTTGDDTTATVAANSNNLTDAIDAYGKITDEATGKAALTAIIEAYNTLNTAAGAATVTVPTIVDTNIDGKDEAAIKTLLYPELQKIHTAYQNEYESAKKQYNTLKT